MCRLEFDRKFVSLEVIRHKKVPILIAKYGQFGTASNGLAQESHTLVRAALVTDRLKTGTGRGGLKERTAPE